MDCAQINPLSLIEGRLLEGEKGLAYWCMLAITLLPTLCFSFSLFHYFVFSHFFIFYFFIFSFSFYLCDAVFPDVAVM